MDFLVGPDDYAKVMKRLREFELRHEVRVKRIRHLRPNSFLSRKIFSRDKKGNRSRKERERKLHDDAKCAYGKECTPTCLRHFERELQKSFVSSFSLFL